MSDGDDSSGPKKRVAKRERVTLKWSSPPLLLPGEQISDVELDASGELQLPDPGEDDALAGSSSSPPVAELDDGVDAWERQKPAWSSPPPPRPTAEPGGSIPLGAEADGGALSLVDKRSRPSSPTIDLAGEMNERFALGDYTAALRVAELILGQHPKHIDAQRVSDVSREKLAQLYGSRLGSLKRVPLVAVEGSDVRWLGLDHRAGFLLSRVDGAATLEQLIDVSGMQRLEALKTFVELLDMGAIRFVD